MWLVSRVLTKSRIAKNILASIALMIWSLLSRPRNHHISMLLLHVVKISLERSSPLKLCFCFCQYLFLLFTTLGKMLAWHCWVAWDFYRSRLSDCIGILFLIGAIVTHHIIPQKNLSFPILRGSSTRDGWSKHSSLFHWHRVGKTAFVKWLWSALIGHLVA